MENVKIKPDFAGLQRAVQLKKSTGGGVKYTFRNAEEIYDLFKTLKSDWILTTTDDIVSIEGRLFIKAIAKVSFLEETHEATGFAELSNTPILEVKVWENGKVVGTKEQKQMQDPQWTGAVSSYARKYALQGLFAIGEKDVDEFPVTEETKPQQKPTPQPKMKPQVVQAKPIEKPKESSSIEEKFNRGISAAEKLGADDGQVTAWKTMPVDLAIRDIATFVKTQKEIAND